MIGDVKRCVISSQVTVNVTVSVCAGNWSSWL